MSEWISVKDRLPELEGDFIVFGKPYANKGHAIALACFQDDGEWVEADDTFGWVFLDKEIYASGFSELENVTHWQPLPEPPKD